MHDFRIEKKYASRLMKLTDKFSKNSHGMLVPFWGRTDGWTDGQIDRRMEWNQYNPFNVI